MVKKLLESDSFLDSDDHPDMLFVSKGFHWISEDEAVLQGDLTIRGIKHPVGFHVCIEDTEEEYGEVEQPIKIKVSTRISRSKFGLSSLVSVISDELSLCMQLEANRIPV